MGLSAANFSRSSPLADLPFEFERAFVRSEQLIAADVLYGQDLKTETETDDTVPQGINYDV